MLKKTWTRVALVVLLVLLATGGLYGATWAGPGVGDPDPGTVAGITTWTLYPTTAITGNGTIYSSSPRYYNGLDLTRVKNFNSLDVFVTVDIASTGTLTVTPQYSADGTNWANATRLSEGWVLPLSYSATLTNSSGVTNTTTSTSTTSFSGSTASRQSEEITYQIVLSADGTDYVRIPVVGEYVRFSLAYTGTMTPTIKATVRNN